MAKILVVDDDPVMQMTVQRVLEQPGHAVVFADDGAQQRPDLPIIMTSGRPRMLGSMHESDYLTMATKLGPRPAQAVRAGSSVCDGRRLSRLSEPVHCAIQVGP